MTKKDFLKFVTGGRLDIVGLLLELLSESAGNYCVIGGLGVNAYVAPVVSLDLDIIVVSSAIEDLIKRALKVGFTVEKFEHSINLAHKDSDLRIQIQKDPRYQDFLGRATKREVLSYQMNVAALKDIIQGKLWAYLDTTRRKSKRQKDLADIFRLVEEYPELVTLLPKEVAKLFE